MPRSTPSRPSANCVARRRRISYRGFRTGGPITWSRREAAGRGARWRRVRRAGRGAGGVAPIIEEQVWRRSMANVSIAGVHKHFGSTHVIRGVDIAIADGEFCVLVGPSGCGKSTLLRMIAGLEEIGEGTVSIGGTVVNKMPPKERDIAMVFQNYALYPHMTVRDN